MRTLAERFEPKYVKKDIKACWHWTAKTNNMGYGLIRRGPATEGWILAHRAAWWLYWGIEPPDDMCVLHECDTPSCVNPYHLFLGTKLDNSWDMARKGRAAHMSVDPDTVRSIVHSLSLGIRPVSISKSLNVPYSVVKKISSYQTGNAFR